MPDLDSTSSALMQRLRDREDAAAWERFCHLYTPMLDRWARGLGLQDQDVADLVQDVLFAVVKRFSSFEYDRTKSFRSWLKAVALNKWRDRIRAHGNHAVNFPADYLESINAKSVEFEEQEYRRELLSRGLELVVAEFQEKTWRAFVLHGIEGKRAADVAKELGMSETAVYVAKCRVLSRLRLELGDLLR